MLRNCEELKMVLVSSTTNEWPQIDDQNLMASTIMGMEKASEDQIQQQQQQAVLKCPRCDSTNTKFCYYNNYSLSQPRHFCKACKRYWTRGGTLRNVPVGGGCRKNKRVKRPPPASASASASATAVDNSPSSATTPMSTTSPSTTINPLFYNIHSNSELNLSFPKFNSNSTRVDTSLVYDFDHLHPLGFLSGQLMANDVTSQTLLSSSYNSIPNFGSLSSIVSASPTMASLLASSVQQQKFIPGNNLGSNNNFLEFGHYEDDMQMQGLKEVKMEECQNRLNQIQQIESADPSSVFWSANGVGSWLDPANIGSNSVSSLI